MLKKALPTQVRDLEEGAAAYLRVESRALALSEKQFTALNVDVVTAARRILTVATRVGSYRAQIAAELPTFDLRNVDELVDYAKAAWYAAVTKVPEPEPEDVQPLLDEATGLRTHLLTWARPLSRSGKFDSAAVDALKDRAHQKNLARELNALVVLYQSNWDDVRSMCGVTAAEVERAAGLVRALFDMNSRRENEKAQLPEGSVNVRRFWTLADRAYDQCQRAIAFLEWGLADLADIAPSLRGNSERDRAHAAK